MIKRWKLSTDGGTTYDRIVTPINLWGFEWTRDLNGGQIFWRKKLTTSLTFGKDDFDVFYNLERTSVYRCSPLYIRQERLCDGQWRVFWTGRFSAGSGAYDFDNCECTFKPDVYDRYTCIIDHLNDKVNLMDVPPVTMFAVPFPSGIEFDVCIDLGPCIATHGSPPDYLDGWRPVPGSTFVCGSGNMLYYWRERAVTQCVAGSPVPPPGANWQLLENNCSTDGTAVYVRPPSVTWTYDDPTVTESSTPVPVPPSDPCQLWIYMGTFFVDPFAPCYAHAWMCPYTGDKVQYDTGRTVLSGLNYMLEKSGCNLGVVSDFFEWNPIGDAPGYVAGENYITGEDNKVDNLLLIQKSDAIDPSASNPATIGEMTLGQMFELMRKAFNVFWDIDDAGNLRLEHWHYWTFAQGLDVFTDMDARKMNAGRNKFEHLAQELPSHEKFQWQEAQGQDFVGLDIVYDNQCVSTDDRDATVQTTINFVTTDLPYIIGDPDAIAKQGFALVSCDVDGSDYVAVIDTGALSGYYVLNAPLSWANLHRDFFTWNRYFRRGNMNGHDVDFDGYLPNIQQVSVRAGFCCGMEDWDPNGTVKTELGEYHLQQRQGHVEKATLDEREDKLNLTLRYAY